MKQTLYCLNLFIFLICESSFLYSQIEEPTLERKIAYPDSIVYVPYSNLCFINRVELKKRPSAFVWEMTYDEKKGLVKRRKWFKRTSNTYGWILYNDMKASKRRSILIIEMNSTDVYSKYSSGSVQLLIEMPDFEDSFQFDMRSKKIKTHLVNNYGGIEATDDNPEGILELMKINGKIKISGKVILTTSKPFTKQIAEFDDDSIPDYCLDKFIVKEEVRKQKREDFKREFIDLYVQAIMTTDSIRSVNNKPNDSIEKEVIPGQEFRLSYSTIGLGSNRFSSETIIIEVHNSILSYGVMELSDEVSHIDFATGLVTWKEKRVWYNVPFFDSIPLCVVKATITA